ncbi:hypothetical protein D3C76_904060 [compost metagenome]
MNGSSNCTLIFTIASRVEPPSPCTSSSKVTSNGVRKIPNRLDAAALQIAAGMLPRANEVKAIADCTVAGSAQR